MVFVIFNTFYFSLFLETEMDSTDNKDVNYWRQKAEEYKRL